MAWLVVGLGNPGREYEGTRHNVGAVVAAALAEPAGERFRKVRFLPVEAAELRLGGKTVLVARPLTYMNESGPPVGSLAKRRGVDAGHVVVVHDEIDLPLGALQVKEGGSTAGHRGLDSIVSGLRTPDFLRVRVGVGRPPGRKDPADYVLEPFSAGERGEIGVIVEEAADAVCSIIGDGVAAAQEWVNRRAP